MKYRVEWEEITACEAEIEADSKEEAIAQSYNLNYYSRQSNGRTDGEAIEIGESK